MATNPRADRDAAAQGEIRSEAANADEAERQRVARTEESRRAAADPDQKWPDGEYEALQPIEHDGKPVKIGDKLKLKGPEALELARVGAVKARS